MNKSFKLRYLFCVRFDSQNLLKILITFNIFLGIYLLFLSTNNRKYEYSFNRPESLPFLRPTQQIALKGNVPEANVEANVNQNNVPDNAANNVGDGIKNLKQVNNEQISVDKIYDSNNKLVVQEADNAPDASYKRVEEDDKSLDEIDKLRIDMIDKGNSNSIIHDKEFGKSSNKKDDSKNNDDLNKDVINRILDHNLHINKNGTKLIRPEAINVESPWWTAEVRGKYAVLRDYIQGSVQLEPNAKSVTLTTQGTTDFFQHAPQLCERWDGLISISVYAPGDEFRLAINSIYYLRQCGPKCVSERIYWHFVYDTLFAPTNVTVPAAYLETQNFDCNIPMEENMKLLNLKSGFRKAKSLPYPINVLRNVARLGTKTKYLFASDIELYPSVGIVPAFFDLLEREKKGLVPSINPKNRHVYVVPIFEVKANMKPPRTKAELANLFTNRDAIFFHRYVCDLCQNFPKRDVWIKQIPENNSLNVFQVTHRYRERNQWEPLYIGTNDEPFYDERLTWDGKRDKMSQMYEMCLMNYDLLILDNAFLVHAPGIKFYSVKDDAKRLPFIKANQKVYNLLLSKLRVKYGTKNKC